MSSATMLARLAEIHADIAQWRKDVETEPAAQRAGQQSQELFNKDVAAFIVELQGTLTRIEQKLGINDGGPRRNE